MENSCASVEENRAEDNFDLVERRISDWPKAGSQASLGPKLAYRIETREDRVADAVVRVAIDVRRLRERIDRATRLQCA